MFITILKSLSATVCYSSVKIRTTSWILWSRVQRISVIIWFSFHLVWYALILVYKTPVRRYATDPDYLMFERVLRNDLIQLYVLYNTHLISMKESYSTVNNTFSQLQVIVEPGTRKQCIHFKRNIGARSENDLTSLQ